MATIEDEQESVDFINPTAGSGGRNENAAEHADLLHNETNNQNPQDREANIAFDFISVASPGSHDVANESGQENVGGTNNRFKVFGLVLVGLFVLLLLGMISGDFCALYSKCEQSGAGNVATGENKIGATNCPSNVAVAVDSNSGRLSKKITLNDEVESPADCSSGSPESENDVAGTRQSDLVVSKPYLGKVISFRYSSLWRDCCSE